MFRRRIPTVYNCSVMSCTEFQAIRSGSGGGGGVFTNKGKDKVLDPKGESNKIAAMDPTVLDKAEASMKVLKQGSWLNRPEVGRHSRSEVASAGPETEFNRSQSFRPRDRHFYEPTPGQWPEGGGAHAFTQTNHLSGNDLSMKDDLLGSKVDVEWPHDPNPEENPIPHGTGVDNVPGVYTTKREPAWFEKGKYAPLEPTHTEKESRKVGYKSRTDNINTPEYQTILGNYESRPPGLPGVAGMRSFDEQPREPLNKTTVEWGDIHGYSPDKDHHPLYDYTNKTGKFDGKSQGDNHLYNWDIKKSIHSLYKASLMGIGMVKQYYWLKLGLDEMAKRIRDKFMTNKHVKDVEAIRALLMYGWQTYNDIIAFRMQRGGVSMLFHDTDTYGKHAQIVGEQEKLLFEEKAWWQGAEQKAEGPYEGGQWSDTGVFHAKFQKELAGRVPQSHETSKGYFDPYTHDGTNFWEKNLDYEGWAEGSVDPDRATQRRDRSNIVSATYLRPKHTVSKQRRQYRRKVKDYENMMNSPMIQTYASKREIKFQAYMKEGREESNRLYAEKKLAMEDDDMFTKNWELIEPAWKQTYREFPNPRLWRTDAFFARLNFLLAPSMEYNWAKAPIGLEQEKLYNEWQSNTLNYAVHTSDSFANIKSCKKRNPMAQTPAEFYSAFDPDQTTSRKLPWFHCEFNFDRRRQWDEWCMRQKKWSASGDLDSKRGHFEAELDANVEQVNRVDLGFAPDAAGHGVKQLTAARKAQLYRALIRRNDIALTNQMTASLRKSNAKLDTLTQQAVRDLVGKHDWSLFKFEVPTVIYPDGWEQPALNLDGTPVDGVSTGTPPEGSSPPSSTSSDDDAAPADDASSETAAEAQA